jgi:DNA-binding LacI/PurR family transcriptional regulator
MSTDRATAKDIAEIAGVTAGTVSRAMRGDPLVTEKTRLKILQIAKELNYRPNLSARALKTGSAGTLALACPTGGWVLHHPHFAPMHAGFIMAASEEEVRVTIYVPPASGSWPVTIAKHAWPMEMLNGLVDGCLIYQTHALALESVQYLRDARLAVVLMNVDREIPGFFQILGNAEQRIRESVRWAQELGARRVGVLGLSERMQHANSAMRAGAKSAPGKVEVGFEEIHDNHPDQPEAVDRAITALMAGRPDAVIFNSTVHAVRFLQRRKLGKLPSDTLLFFHKPDKAPWALPGMHYMVADLLGMGRTAYGLIKEAKLGRPPRIERLRWSRMA